MQASIRIAESRGKALVSLASLLFVSACNITIPGPNGPQNAQCLVNNAQCGPLTDSAGSTVSCGDCPQGDICKQGACVAKPADCTINTCQAQSRQCGKADDGCGGQLFCGSCNAGAACSAQGTCVACVPKTCTSLAAICGELSDGCGQTLQCGTCATGQTCAGGTCISSDTTHQRADNPFAGAKFYINPEYLANVETSQAAAPADLRASIDKVKAIPTAIWLDRIATIAGTSTRRGVTGHLDEALRQASQSGSTGGPMLVMFVVYDLPNRDCAAFASNGELQVASDGLKRYQQEYIDPLVTALKSNPAYNLLRVVAIIEPDSLPNLITNLGIYDACRQAESAYKEGVKYAVEQLAEVPNVYMYLDIAHSGWLGWEHTTNAANLYKQVLGTDLAKVRGFATNVANYTTTKESFDPYVDVNANQSLIVNFYEWNRMIDEMTYVQALKQQFPDKGFIIDTSRNGWRSRGATTPMDTRTHRGNWCNITGAGLGERPRANPVAGLDAYFFIKPPGESDGTSDATVTTPNDEGKSFDKMCGQTPVVRPYDTKQRAIPTDALAGAPHAGHWFDEQFWMLVRNANPPLSSDPPPTPTPPPSPPPTPPPTPTPTPGAQGRWTGVNWFGFETSNLAPHGLWARDYKSMLKQIRDLGFNSIRLPWCNAALTGNPSGIQINAYGVDGYTKQTGMNTDLQGLSSLQVMDAVVAEAGKLGLKIILDNHSREPDGYLNETLWYTAKVSEAQWIEDWKFLAARYVSQANVVGADLDNEPHGNTGQGQKPPASWGSDITGFGDDDWKAAAERCGLEILKVNPNLKIIVEGVEQYASDTYWWGGNLAGVRDAPITVIDKDHLVYSAHEYGPEVYNQSWFSAPDFPDNMTAIWDEHFLFIATQGIAPLYIGEFGIKEASAADPASVAYKWITKLLQTLGKTTSWTFWCMNPNSGDTGGILQDDWVSVNQAKYNLLKPYLEPM